MMFILIIYFTVICVVEPPAPAKTVVNPFAIERPHAAPHLLERQGSFRGLSQLNQSSPFKRQMSLRIGDLPSTVERQQNSLSNDAPSYKSNLSATPGKIFTLISLLAWCCVCVFFIFILCCVCCVACLICVESPQPPPRVSRHRLQPTPSQEVSSSELFSVFLFLFYAFTLFCNISCVYTFSFTKYFF